jgi:hypothetical protein
MKPSALALLVVVVLGATPARAEPVRGRGFLTGLGIGLLTVGFAGSGLGLAGLISANDAAAKLRVFPTPPPEAESAAVRALLTRSADNTSLAAVGFVMAGVGVIGGILCLALDSPPPVASVAFAPTPGGGAFVFSARF